MSDTGVDQVAPAVRHSLGNSEGIGRKVHGLPIWAWAILVVGGGLLVYYLYRKFAGGGSAAATSANGTGLAGGDTSGSGGDDSSGNIAPGTSPFSSNSAYLSAAVSEFGNGANTPISVTQALSDLFNGNPLSQGEQAIVNQVEGGLGAPPEATPAPVLAPPAAPATTTSVVDYVKTANDATIYQLGSDNVLHPITSWGEFTNLNPSQQYSTIDQSAFSKYTVGSDLS